MSKISVSLGKLVVFAVALPWSNLTRDSGVSFRIWIFIVIAQVALRTDSLKVFSILIKRRAESYYTVFLLRFRHSVKLPEYIAQLLSLGVTALIKAGHAINAIGKLRAKVPGNRGQATSAGNKPTAVNCQSIKHVPTNRVKA